MLKKCVLTAAVVLACPAVWAVTINVDITQERAAISPYIYGHNNRMATVVGSEPLFTAMRLGGNRTTTLNWETNASNAGSDWNHISDAFWCGNMNLTSGECATAGATHRKFMQECNLYNWYPMVTLPMSGYVAADKNNTAVTEAETAPSARWLPVLDHKPGWPGTLVYPPNTGDGYVYNDELISYLISQFGNSSSATGVKAYLLDNEPGLWDYTHIRVHPAKVGCVELINRSVPLAKTIKDMDAGAAIYGFEAFGYYAYWGLDAAPDWAAEKGSFRWFIDYYLSKMNQASQTDGRRLLDYLSLHYYSEALQAGSRVTSDGDPAVNAEARKQAPRSLWDASYNEGSWINGMIGGAIKLIPDLQVSINSYYPGTKISFTEWAFGGGTHVSGGIAAVDTLGIFGKYGVGSATGWGSGNEGAYNKAAFRIFRDYNGAGGTYGDIKVRAESNDIPNMTVYASVRSGNDGELHLVIINKANSAQNANVAIVGSVSYTSGQAWAFDSTTHLITSRSAPAISSNSFSYTMPANSVYHFVFSGTVGTPTRTRTPGGPTETITRTWSRTPTVTPTSTNTPVPCSIINYSGEAPDNIGSGGTWIGVSGTVSEVTTQSHSATHSMQIHFVWSDGWYQGMGWNWANWMPAGDVYNASGSTGIEMWLRAGAGIVTTLKVQLVDTSATASNSLNISAYLPGGVNTSWQRVEIPIADFTGIDKSSLWEFRMSTGGSQAGDQTIYLDDLSFLQPCGNTPTITGTAAGTPSGTVTNTPVNTGTGTRTRTPSSTPTGTLVNTGTYTYTRTPSRTPTNTAVNTATLTRTATPSGTVTGTAGITFTRTNTVVNTSTGTPVNTNTYIRTATRTSTMTRTPGSTSTSTSSVQPTNTSSVSGTPSATRTLTATSTGSMSNTPTAAGTLTRTATATHTRTWTSSYTSSATRTATPSRTGTPTPTPTRTATPSLTDSPVYSLTETSTGTPPTDTNTPTVTMTGTSTYTFTPSRTYTATCTRTATASVTGTSTNSESNTPTVTGTPTGTRQDTATNTPANTATSTASTGPSSTNTPINPETVTSSAVPTSTDTPANTATFTHTPANTVTATYSAVPSSTNTPLPTSTVSPSRTRTATVLPTMTVSPTLTPAPPAGTLQIEDVILYPNPLRRDSGDLNVLVQFVYNSDTPESITMDIYTASFRLIRREIWDTSLTFPESRNAVRGYTLGSLASGVYYCSVQAAGSTGSVSNRLNRVFLIIK